MPLWAVRSAPGVGECSGDRTARSRTRRGTGSGGFPPPRTRRPTGGAEAAPGDGEPDRDASCAGPARPRGPWAEFCSASGAVRRSGGPDGSPSKRVPAYPYAAGAHQRKALTCNRIRGAAADSSVIIGGVEAHRNVIGDVSSCDDAATAATDTARAISPSGAPCDDRRDCGRRLMKRGCIATMREPWFGPGCGTVRSLPSPRGTSEARSTTGPHRAWR